MDGRRAGFWPAGAVACLLTLTLVSQSAASELPAEEDPTNWRAPDEQKPRETELPGLVLRAGAEYSWLRYALRARGGRLAPGVHTSFERDFHGSSSAWGAHFLGGVGFHVSPALRIVPLLAGSVHSLGQEEFPLNVAGLDHRFGVPVTYWTLAGGCELQFLERMLLLSFQGGGASVQARAPRGQSGGLQVELDDLGGVYGRAGIGFRLPADFPLGGVLMTAFDGMWSPTQHAVAYRVSGGLFLDLDMGRL